jgi:hypothetical protein
MSRITALLMTVVVLASPGATLFAQDVAATSATAPSEATAPQTGEGSVKSFYGVLNCSDYYKQDSVKAEMKSEIEKTLPGATVLLTGQLKNENSFPIVDGFLFAKVFKDDSAVREASGANEVVDQLIVKEDISLPSRGALPIEHEWTVPINAEGGTYYVEYYLLDAKRFQFIKSPYAEVSVGVAASLVIEADYQVAKFDKANTTLNGEAYTFGGQPVGVAPGEPIVVSVTIENASDQPKTMPLQWNQFAWDDTNADNLRSTKTEVVKFAAGESKTFTYTAVAQTEPVVHITASTQDIETKSLISVRAVKSDVSGTQFGFVGISEFPVTAGKEQAVVACVNGYGADTEGNVLTLSLTDKDGNGLHQYRYEGKISGALSGFGEKFTLDKTVESVTLTARLERDGVVLDEITRTYTCEDLNQEGCDGTSDQLNEMVPDWLSKTMLMTIGGGVLLLILIILTVLLLRRRGKKKATSNIIDGMEMKMPEYK